MQRLYALSAIVLFMFGPPILQAEEPDAAEVKLFKVQLFLAKNGDADGQYYLAEMYEKGLGTPRDMQQALAWYKKSAERGSLKAGEKLANWEKNQENARKAKERAEADTKAAELAKVKQQEEAEAAAKAAKTRAAAETARRAAEQAKAAELAKVKQQEEAEAAAKAAKTRAAAETARRAAEEPAKPKNTASTPEGNTKIADPKNSSGGQTPAVAKEKNQDEATNANAKENNNTEGFTSNPCKGPQAKFLSTCR